MMQSTIHAGSPSLLLHRVTQHLKHQQTVAFNSSSARQAPEFSQKASSPVVAYSSPSAQHLH